MLHIFEKFGTKSSTLMCLISPMLNKGFFKVFKDESKDNMAYILYNSFEHYIKQFVM